MIRVTVVIPTFELWNNSTGMDNTASNVCVESKARLSSRPTPPLARAQLSLIAETNR